MKKLNKWLIARSVGVRPHRNWLSIILLSVVIGHIYAAEPIQMTHIIVRLSGTEISATSFAGKQKVYWRASNRYCRVDEEPDPEKGIHGRTVINEPNAWLINLADHTARHLVDPGPTFNCRLPIFANDPAAMKTKIGELEFGRELEFFESNGAKQVEGPQLEFKANFYELAVGDAVLKLVERADSHVPILIGLVQGDKVTQVRYLLWEQQPFQAALFTAPTGVTIQEVK